jgi:DMSO/TMAO reductase YedYZ heme-binding membrane subunit
MLFMISLLVVTALVVVLRSPIKKFPVICYALGLAFTVLYLYANFFGAPVPLWRYLLIFMQRCSIGLALLTLVMFAGVFPEDSRARALLTPLRRELSILGCIFASGHVIAYASVFIPRLFGDFASTQTNLLVSLVISIVLSLLLLILTVTSFVVVRRIMNPAVWKRVQLLAYPFFGLIYLHLAFVLMPSVLAGYPTALINLVVYTVMFTSYFVLRVRKAAADIRHSESTLQRAPGARG